MVLHRSSVALGLKADNECLKGGKARAEKVSTKKRSEIAQKAARLAGSQRLDAFTGVILPFILKIHGDCGSKLRMDHI
jgi:hypothetical protein